MIEFRFFLLLPILLVWLSSHGQESVVRVNIESENYSVFNWNSEHGLPQNSIRDILEDKNGMIWIATFNGLARFDGHKFKVYNQNNVPEITNPSILSMLIDHSGNFWFTTPNELVLYAKGKFTRFDIPTDETYYLFEFRKKLFIWSPTGIYDITEEKFIPDCSKSGKLIETFKLGDEVIYLSGHKLFKFSDHSLYSEGKFHPRGKQFVASFDEESFFKLTPSGLKRFKYQKNKPWSAQLLEDDKLYFTNRDSVYVVGPDGNYLFNCSFTDLNTSRMSIAFEASNGVVWLGSSNNGLYMLYPKRFRSISSIHPNIQQTGNFVYQAKDSTIWLDGKCGELFSTRDFGVTLKRHEVRCCGWGMAEDVLGDMWLVSLHRGAHKNGGDEVDTNFRDGYQLAHSLYKTSNDRLLLGTSLGVYEIKDDKSQLIPNSSFGFIYYFYEDRNGKLLVCSSEGLGVLSKKGIDPIEFWKDPLDVRSVYQDANMNYWIGTDNTGLYMFDGKKAFHFPTSIESIPKDVWCILEDKKGFFWINTNNGIFRLSKKDLVNFSKGKIKSVYSIRFGSQDGLINVEGNSRTQNKAFVDFQGNFWFSTIAGPVWVDPLKITTNTFKNPIIIDDILVEGNRVSDKDIVLKPGQGHIQFNFAQANFLDTRHLGYKYRIIGLDNKWIHIGNVRTINLTELPAGSYKLEIRQEGTGISKTVPFSVEVHFYESTIFYIAVGATGTVLVLLFLFWIWRKQKSSSQKILELNEILKNLKVKALQSQMNPHFIFNCLNSIQSLYIIGEQNKANKYMTNFSSLLRTVINHSDQKEITIQEEIDMYNVYIPLEALQLNDSFQYSIEVDDSINTKTVKIPSMISQTFVENAIKHGLKPLKDREGKLTIKISQDAQYTTILIEDNGIGIEESMRLKKTMNVAYKSMGTKITQERIELMNTLDELEIIVNLKPLEDGPGTRVELLFPNRPNS